jgi:NDP-sugar pyrophosphorylase family protein
MDYAIIAAGEGSRLAKGGFPLPKPMVTLNGEMLIDRLITIFTQNEQAVVRIIINEQSPKLEEHLSDRKFSPALKIVKKSTPSSLHSFYELLQAAPELEAICLTTTDTVFKEEEFAQFIQAFEADKELDGLMAVTSFIDDESPLFVSVDAENNITAFTDQNTTNTTFVSGGIYCLRRKALDTALQSVEQGVSRMRNFQRQLLNNNLKIKAFSFSKIVDIDHVRDILTAEQFLSATT